jgi:hypothetical protein
MVATNSKPGDVTGPPNFSPEAQDMLRVFGKSHLRDVTEDEWSRYGAGRSISEALCGEFLQWNCPDVDFLVLIHGTDPLAARVQHWTSIHDRTADPHVKWHALEQIKLLEANRDEH